MITGVFSADVGIEIGAKMPKLPLYLTRFLLVTLLAASGCALKGQQYPAAKWAMDDPQYYEEHHAPYSRDPAERRAQKWFDRTDASFQTGKSGVYVNGGSSAFGYPAAIGSMGFTRLPTANYTVRGGVMGMDNGGIGVGGAEVGVRFHAATRFSPYVGVSGDLGFASMHQRWSRNRYRTNQLISVPTGIAAVAPEAGVSYWLNPSSRLSAGASYFIASGQPDFLQFGAMLEFMLFDSYNPNNDSVPPRSSWDNELMDDESDRTDEFLNQYLSKFDDDRSMSTILPAWNEAIPEFDESNSSSAESVSETFAETTLRDSKEGSQDGDPFPPMLTEQLQFPTVK